MSHDIYNPIKLTPGHLRVLCVLRLEGPLTPTQIGNVIGYEYESASSRVTRALHRLVETGLVKETRKNKRVVSYKVAKAVLPPIELCQRGRSAPKLPIDTTLKNEFEDLLSHPSLKKTH